MIIIEIPHLIPYLYYFLHNGIYTVNTTPLIAPNQLLYPRQVKWWMLIRILFQPGPFQFYYHDDGEVITCGQDVLCEDICKVQQKGLNKTVIHYSHHTLMCYSHGNGRWIPVFDIWWLWFVNTCEHTDVKLHNKNIMWVEHLFVKTLNIGVCIIIHVLYLPVGPSPIRGTLSLKTSK